MSLDQEKHNKKREEIQSYIFIDLETTSLYNDPRILELALIAISRRDLLEAQTAAKKYVIYYGASTSQVITDKSKIKPELPALPRVMHKFIQLYYPRKIIRKTVEEITGLSNDALHHLNPFNVSSAQTIHSFMSSLPQPSCLVAHNGLGYDFAIVKSELELVDAFSGFENFYCVDTLKCIRELDAQNEANKAVKDNNNTLPTDIQDTLLTKVNDSFVTPDKSQQIKELPQTPVKKIVKRNGSTPPSNRITTPTNGSTPPSNGKSKPDPLRATARRRLAFTSPTKKSYKQTEIFSRLFAKEYDAHKAEADAIALMRICIQYKTAFVEWSDENAVRFGEVKSKWRIKKQIR